MGQWWYTTLEGLDGLMGQGIREPAYHHSYENRSAHLDTGIYEKFTTVSCFIFNGFLSIDEDGFRIRRMRCFCKLFEILKSWKEFLIIQSSFIYFEHRIQGWKVLHPIPGNKYLLLFIWTKSYQFSLQSISWVCLCWWQ